MGWGSTPEVHFVLRNYAVRYGKAKRFVLRIINSTHIPLTTKENKIRNAKDEIIADIQKLEEELPENCQQNKDYIFPFDDAFIKTDCGNIKIKEIKFEYENHTEMKQFKIDAQNITKAILKNTISKEVQLIGKTYMDYKSQMK